MRVLDEGVVVLMVLEESSNPIFWLDRASQLSDPRQFFWARVSVVTLWAFTTSTNSATLIHHASPGAFILSLTTHLADDITDAVRWNDKVYSTNT